MTSQPCPYWLVVYLCWAGTFSNLLPIFNCIICFLIILEQVLHQLGIVQILLPSLWLVFSLLNVSLDEWKSLILMKSIFLFIYILYNSCSLWHVLVIFANTILQRFSPVFSSRNCIIAVLMFRSMIHLTILYMVWGKAYNSVFFLHDYRIFLNTIHSPLKYLGTFIKSRLTVWLQIYFWTLFSSIDLYVYNYASATEFWLLDYRNWGMQFLQSLFIF